MPKSEQRTELAALEAAAQAGADAHYVFRLFVTGCTPHSAAAIVNVRRFCEEKLAGRFRLEIRDLVVDPRLAAEAQIVATPTLIRDRPLPQRRFVGNMSRMERVLVAPRPEPGAKRPVTSKRSPRHR